MFDWFALGWCFKNCFLILLSEHDVAKNISSVLGICSALHSQAKAGSSTLFGKSSSSLGIWADWDLGLGKHWLQWFFRHLPHKVLVRECCELQAPLPLSPSQCSVACGYGLSVLFSFPEYQVWWLWVSGGDGCVWWQRLHIYICKLTPAFFVCNDRRSLLMWLLCSEPFHLAHLMKMCDNCIAGLCNCMFNCVGTRGSVSWVSQGEQRLACFLIRLYMPPT